MNQYLRNLRKIEFVVTDACTGRCKHCSEGEHTLQGNMIDADTAADAVRRIAEEYDIQTVMTFGGEPLLHIGAVEEIMTATKEMGVARLQVITNGYFSRSIPRIREVAERLSRCGVNDLLLSVDAFHQETIPFDFVRIFAEEAKKCHIPIRLNPAWLKSREDDNPYNLKTKDILNSISDLHIPVCKGNVIFPEGNALKYLGEYFEDIASQNPYVEDPCDVKCISFAANGDVLSGNVYQRDIMEIIDSYDPYL